MTSLMESHKVQSLVHYCLIYINDLNNAIKFSSIRHFVDDSNILYRNKSLRKINQRINFGLRNFNEWLRANRIALNTNKIKIIMFRTPRKALTRKSLSVDKK